MDAAEGMTILVTGATDGIGRQTALELVKKGHHVIVHGRSEARVGNTLAELRRAGHGARVDGVVFDLGSLAAVRAGAERLRLEQPKLQVIINNAGVFAGERTLSVDGHELTFAVNHLAHVLLTELLLPRLAENAPARIVNVSSNAHQGARLDLDDLDMTRGYTGFGAYASSKLANILHANALAVRLDPARVTANSLHPGVIGTKLLRQGWGASGGSLEQGARTSLRVALDAQLAGVSGRYFSDGREARPSPAALDETLRDRLHEASLRLVGLA
jgi:NAD(P)-dependent dehydrogenase (short-subunit alcohol dehydrogenase family)